MEGSFYPHIFHIGSSEQFNGFAMDLFQYQAKQNPVYREYLSHLHLDPLDVKTVDDIPFLPIEFFKSHEVTCLTKEKPQLEFTSSGTTGQKTSRHLVYRPSLYRDSFTKGFQLVYGAPEDWTIIALLPTYLEREGSSLVYMMEYLIAASRSEKSGFFLHQLDEVLQILHESTGKTLLIGVTYALLDLAKQNGAKHFQNAQVVVMETGGMKGNRPEMTRNEVHNALTESFGTPHIHSEYGMTELLSQAYSVGQGIFRCPPWMRVKIRDIHDPFARVVDGRTGGINIIDLANIDSCAFIETKDLGKQINDGFQVLGRIDNTDIRGCNLMSM